VKTESGDLSDTICSCDAVKNLSLLSFALHCPEEEVTVMMEIIQPDTHKRGLSTGTDYPSMNNEYQSDAIDLSQEAATTDTGHKRPRTSTDGTLGVNSTTAMVDHPCTNMACQHRLQELQQERTRLKQIINSLSSVRPPSTPAGSIGSSSVMVTPATGARAPPSTPATSSSAVPAPLIPTPTPAPAPVAAVVNDGRVSHKRDMMARGITKQLVWKDACKKGNGAKWMWEGECTFPELLRILKLPDGTKQFGMKKIPVADFQAAVGPIKAKARFDVLTLTGENVIVHFNGIGMKVTGTYGKSGEKRFPW
jgi:hypothetical protein